MGQYFIAIILGEKPEEGEKETIRVWMTPHTYRDGSKLMEHSCENCNFMKAVEDALCPDGSFYKSRVVWAGDYADKEPCGKNLYHIAQADKSKYYISPSKGYKYKYIVNHTKKEYIQRPRTARLHPLSLLTAEGNGAGSGDYRGSHEMIVGSWARDIISMEEVAPVGYSELDIKFREGGEHDSDSNSS